MTKQAKTVILDIETCAIQAHVWGLWNQNVSLNMIQEDWRLLSFAAKELGDDRVTYLEARHPNQERKVLRAIWRILNEADIVVAHNGKKFDLKKINARLIASGFGPYSPVKVVDTLLEVRKVAAFTSNKLEYLTDILCTEKKLKHSKFPGFELWRECLAGNPEAWAEMREYNIQDIISLEELYVKLRPWIAAHPNLGNFQNNEDGSPVCPKCGGKHLHKRGIQRTQVGQYQRYQCLDCGGWSRGRKMLKTAEERKHILIGQ